MTRHGDKKCVRALALHEKGIDHEAIAERLGSNPRSVAVMIRHARELREKAAGVAE